LLELQAGSWNAKGGQWKWGPVPAPWKHTTNPLQHLPYKLVFVLTAQHGEKPLSGFQPGTAENGCQLAPVNSKGCFMDVV